MRRDLGKPWVSGARGPDCFDCFGLLFDVYRVHKGVELLPYPINPANVASVARAIMIETNGGTWSQVSKPKEFDAVGMSKSKAFHHIGVWTEADGGRVIHANDGQSVMVHTTEQLTQMGFNRIEFFRYAVCP